MNYLTMIKLGFWISVMSAVVFLPYMGLIAADIYFKEEKLSLLHTGTILLGMVFQLLGVIALLAFKSLLNSYANYFGADKVIRAVIFLSVLMMISSSLRFFVDEKSVLMIVLNVIGLLVAGGISIYFGVLISRCPNDLFGFKGMIAKLNIAQGICLVTVVLTIFAVPLQVFMSIVFAMVFYKAIQVAESENASS